MIENGDVRLRIEDGKVFLRVDDSYGSSAEVWMTPAEADIVAAGFAHQAAEIRGTTPRPIPQHAAVDAEGRLVVAPTARFEYRVEYLNTTSGDVTQSELNQYGADGWQVAFVTSRSPSHVYVALMRACR